MGAPTHARVALAVAWGYCVIYAFPGQMSADTFEHLGEARAGIYTDGHPPAMNVVFWLAEQLFTAPLGVLLAQTLGMVLGLYALLRRAFPPARAAWVAALLFVYPPVMVSMAAVWKDAVMPAALVLGTAALLDPRRGVRLAGLGAMFVASAVRYNAFAATFPLIVLLFEWRPMGRVRRYALAAAAWLAITGAAMGLNAALVDVKMHYWHSSLAVHDITGTLVEVDGTLPDAELARLLDGTRFKLDRDIHAALRARYSPRNFFNLVAGEEALWDLPVTGTTPAPEAQRAAIERAWREVVTGHPRAYLAHRLRVMREVLSLDDNRPSSAVLKRSFEYLVTVANMGMSIRASRLQEGLSVANRALNRNTPLFEPWMYLAIAVLLLPLAREHRDAAALLLSGIALELTLLVLAPTPDYRYSHWMITATCIAVPILIARRMRQT